jgi:formylglycine-generating enzyme required for sulfatase activity
MHYPDEASLYAQKRLASEYSLPSVLAFTNSFRMIQDLVKYCHSSYLEKDELKKRLQLLYSNYEKIPDITGERILPLISDGIRELDVLVDRGKLAPRFMRLCDELVELLHMEVMVTEKPAVDRYPAKREESERLQKEKEEQERQAREEEERKAQEHTARPKKILILALVMIGVMAAGYWIMNPGQDNNTYTNSIGMEFVLIPAGEFEMGSPSGEEGRFAVEGPVHTVTIEKAYYLSKYEVTQAQWKEVMGSNPSDFEGDDRPVENVSWNDVAEFIKKLNQMEGTDKYRLPSEAEWEYACRAGTTTRYSFGDNESLLGDYAWYYGNLDRKTHPVGNKKPNNWGLYDMHGNVWEWVQDRWHNNYNVVLKNGSAWESNSGSTRVFRGGGWFSDARSCRSAVRGRFDPDDRGFYVGFRLLQET